MFMNCLFSWTQSNASLETYTVRLFRYVNPSLEINTATFVGLTTQSMVYEPRRDTPAYYRIQVTATFSGAVQFGPYFRIAS